MAIEVREREINFSLGVVARAKVTEYLLEKSRIVSQEAGERGYHVFYQVSPS